MIYLFFWPKIIFWHKSFSDINFLFFLIFHTDIYLAKSFYPIFVWPKNIFAKRVLIDWQNCCDKLYYPGSTCFFCLFFLYILSALLSGSFYKRVFFNRHHLLAKIRSFVPHEKTWFSLSDRFLDCNVWT